MLLLHLILPLLLVFLPSIHSMGMIIDDCATGKPECPPGFKMFKRPLGRQWCMKVFPGNLTWWEAERECRCRVKGATLSGVESSAEMRWLEEQGQQVLDKEHVSNGGIWIGAYRRKDCQGVKSTWESKAACKPGKMFQYTDKHTCSKLMFEQHWADGKPSSEIVNGEQENCGIFLVSTESGQTQSGKVGNKLCSQVTSTPSIYSSKGFVCGIEPHVGTGYGGGGGGMVVIGSGKPAGK